MDSQNSITIVNPFMPAMQIEQVIARRNLMVEFVSKAMTSGTDFGVIPGTGTKPVLLKPGAEKLCTLFGLTPRFTVIESVLDWTGRDHGGEPFFLFWYRCALDRGDNLMAEAEGSCNSMEKKYRWRWAPVEDIPAGLDKATLKTQGGAISEFSFAIEKAETSGKYGKPAEYWKQFRDAMKAGTARAFYKKTKDGKEFEAYEIGATLYRIPNTDIPDQVNTIQKMAQKRALVGAALLAVNASEFFTQDLEDLSIEVEYRVEEKTVAQPTTANRPANPPRPAPPTAAPKRAEWDEALETEQPPARIESPTPPAVSVGDFGAGIGRTDDGKATTPAPASNGDKSAEKPAKRILPVIRTPLFAAQIVSEAKENGWAIDDKGEVNPFRLTNAIVSGGFAEKEITDANWNLARDAMRRHYQAKAEQAA